MADARSMEITYSVIRKDELLAIIDLLIDQALKLPLSEEAARLRIMLHEFRLAVDTAKLTYTDPLTSSE